MGQGQLMMAMQKHILYPTVVEKLLLHVKCVLFFFSLRSVSLSSSNYDTSYILILFRFVYFLYILLHLLFCCYYTLYMCSLLNLSLRVGMCLHMRG